MRRSTSGSIHAPVETPTGTPQAARTAPTTASTTCASSVSRPSAPGGCRWIAPTPAAAQAAASRASSCAVSGTAGCAAVVRSPFRLACSSTSSLLSVGRRSGARGVARRRHADRGGELAHQMRLVVVAERGGQPGPVDVAALRSAGGGVLEAEAPDDPRRSGADVLREQALDRARAHGQPLGELRDARHVAVGGQQLDGVIGELHGGIGLGRRQRGEGRLEHRDDVVELGARGAVALEAIAVEAGKGRGGQALIGDRRDRAAEEGPHAAGGEAQAQGEAGVAQRAPERPAGRAVEPGTAVLLVDEVGRRVRERRLLVRLASAEVPPHAPQPRHVGRQCGRWLPAAQRERALGRRAQHASRRVGDGTTGHRRRGTLKGAGGVSRISKTAGAPRPRLAAMSDATQTTITAEFEITSWDQTPYDEGAEGAELGRATVRKAFTGPLTGTSVAELLLCGSGEDGRGYVASEKVTGTLDGRTGPFVLQHGAVQGPGDDGRTFGHVVPGSGTGELAGLRGDAVYRHDESGARLTLTYAL